MTTRFFVHPDGSYIGGFNGAEPPNGAIEVPSAPEDARQVWNFATSSWGSIPPSIYTLPVAIMWLRMSDEEAEEFDAAMATATPLRLRRAFNTAQTMSSDGELFGFVQGVLVGSTSETRARSIMEIPTMDSMVGVLGPQQAKAEEEE